VEPAPLIRETRSERVRHFERSNWAANLFPRWWTDETGELLPKWGRGSLTSKIHNFGKGSSFSDRLKSIAMTTTHARTRQRRRKEVSALRNSSLQAKKGGRHQKTLCLAPGSFVSIVIIQMSSSIGPGLRSQEFHSGPASHLKIIYPKLFTYMA
jgi:hypothetical protein